MNGTQQNNALKLAVENINKQVGGRCGRMELGSHLGQGSRKRR